MTHRLFSFPNPVNEVSARLVAGGVLLMSLATIIFDQPWLTIFAYCVGCKIFAILIRTGLIPDDVCEECDNIWNRPRTAI